MMGAFLVALDGRLFQHASRVLTSLGAESWMDPHDGAVQFTDDAGRIFTLFAAVPPSAERDVYEGPFTVAQGVRLPDMQRVVACPFECRWPDLVVHMIGLIAQESDSPMWVLDGNGVVWGAETLDPVRLQL